ncbi:MAG: hypothetical protein IT422_16165 [Pirellulaceae bacterium]|jgi:hypothetical protein|nr:hypothetical protein [Pirellulaceae bacterium]
MNPRTKWLAIGGLLVIGFYAADTLYRSWIETPTQQLNAELNALTKSMRETNDQQMLAQKAGKRLESYAARALPYSAQLARSGYQKWLLAAVERNGLQSPTVDAAQPLAIELKSRTKKGKRQSIGFRIGYSLRARATLTKLAQFLHEFRSVGQLHKIRSLALNPTGKEGMLDINMSIEVLGLDASPSKDQLSQWHLTDEAIASLGGYKKFVQRNLFARGFAKALQDVELKAITFDRLGTAQAWFRIDSSGTTRTVGVGDQVPLALHDISVIDILPDKVLVHVNETPYWLTLGQSIAQVSGAEIKS